MLVLDDVLQQIDHVAMVGDGERAVPPGQVFAGNLEDLFGRLCDTLPTQPWS